MNESKNKIIVKVTIMASKKKVWDYYTQPNHIVNWNYASDDWYCPNSSNDMRIGGKYFARMEAKDGSFGFDFEGIYSVIIEGEKLIYSLSDHRIIEVSFSDAGINTEIIITFDAENENSIELQQFGWQSILNNFKNYVETA